MSINGHDYESIKSSAVIANNSDKPICILCKTIKGSGISFIENNAINWHYHTLNEELYLTIENKEGLYQKTLKIFNDNNVKEKDYEVVLSDDNIKKEYATPRKTEIRDNGIHGYDNLYKQCGIKDIPIEFAKKVLLKNNFQTKQNVS